MNRVLVIGLPRSGTTWVARILARAASATYLEEPDNHFRRAYAFHAKWALGRREYPLIHPDGDAEGAHELATLWRRAFTPATASKARMLRRRSANRLVSMAGATRVSAALAGSSSGSSLLSAAAALGVPEQPIEGARGLVVKSVYAPLCAEWIALTNDVPIVLVVRNVLNVLSSWLELGWVGSRGPDMLSTLDPEIARELAERHGTSYPSSGSPLARAAWLAGILTCALEDVARRNPAWPRVVHEELCLDPASRFPALASNLQLAWPREADRLLESLNRPGRGYETRRVAADMPTAWQERLDDDQVRTIREVLEGLPLESSSS